MTQDSQLLTRLKAGDSTAVREWYIEYFPRLLHLLSTRISLEKDAEEVAHDTFLSCLKHLPLFRGESSIWTWMVRIAHHEVADYYRKHYAKKFIHALPLSEFLGIDSVADAHEVSQLVKEILLKMTQESREILQMKYIDKKQVKDIAKEMGKTVKSVESILFRARTEFREMYSLGRSEVKDE